MKLSKEVQELYDKLANLPGVEEGWTQDYGVGVDTLEYAGRVIWVSGGYETNRSGFTCSSFYAFENENEKEQLRQLRRGFAAYEEAVESEHDERVAAQKAAAAADAAHDRRAAFVDYLKNYKINSDDYVLVSNVFVGNDGTLVVANRAGLFLIGKRQFEKYQSGDKIVHFSHICDVFYASTIPEENLFAHDQSGLEPDMKLAAEKYPFPVE